MPGPDTPRRTPQAERSASTRTKLLDATIAALVELGWAGTSTTEVTRRAGVSRGAQVHHYPTKDDLVLAAIQHLLEKRTEEYRVAFDALPADRRTLSDALELLWAQCFGPTFEATLELIVAARHVPELHERVVEMERAFASTAVDHFQAMFPDSFADRALAEVGVSLTFGLLDGLAVRRIAGHPEEELRAAREAFCMLTELFLATNANDSNNSNGGAR